MRVKNGKIKFTDYDFMRLFLSYLVVKGINKIDTIKLSYELSEFYKSGEYKELFEGFSLKKQIEGDFVELEYSVNEAQLCGLLSMPIQGTNSRRILIEEPSKIYNYYSDEYKNKIYQLVSSYINKLNSKKQTIAIIGGPENSSKQCISSFLNKLDSGELKIETCPQVETGEELTEEFIIHQLEDYQKLLDSGIIEEASKEEQGSLKKLVLNKK
jgi:cobalamin biosynthesis Co2+ chelatase CbiK